MFLIFYLNCQLDSVSKIDTIELSVSFYIRVFFVVRFLEHLQEYGSQRIRTHRLIIRTFDQFPFNVHLSESRKRISSK